MDTKEYETTGQKPELKYEGLIIPKDYTALLGIRETEKAIKIIKDTFQVSLAEDLNLERVSAPRFVVRGQGINDDLNGIEKPVSFIVEDADKVTAEVVHSLAKWKRMALKDYGFELGKGLYTDMDAIRAQEKLTNLHSIYVDQWDWEKIISKEDRNTGFLRRIVKKIYGAMKKTESKIHEDFAEITPTLPEDITFIHAEELAKKYPDKSPKQREDLVAKENGAVFIIGIGGMLSDGKPHDGRAPDYDDWTTANEDGYAGLNGDILVWYPVLDRALEISSMGIRVDKDALEKQLEIQGKSERKELLWHKRLLSGDLPLSIGGGIGQSRLCMFFLRKAHIGEVQSSIWPDKMKQICSEKGIFLL